MTSRWAYEAIAVAQYKNNEFEKHYFEVDSEKSRNNFKLSYLIPELQKYVNTCIDNIKNNKNTEQTERYIKILKYELNKLNRNSKLKFSNIDAINEIDLISKTYNDLQEYFSKMTKSLNAEQYKINLKYDSVSYKLKDLYGSNEAVYELKTKYLNKQLEEIVKNKGEFDAIKEEGYELVQVIDPIFKIPDAKNGRAHFYAPVKRIGNQLFDTVWFNVIFIWFTSLLIYLMLIFNLLRKFMDFLGRIM